MGNKEQEKTSALEKTVKSTLSKELKMDVSLSFDKAHRIGPRRGKNQSVIARFAKHSTATAVYENRKKSRIIKIRPSLTDNRGFVLRRAREMVEGNENVAFTYTDMSGNLKIRLKEPLENRYVHVFNDIPHLTNILTKCASHEVDDFSSDYHYYSEYDDNDGEKGAEMDDQDGSHDSTI